MINAILLIACFAVVGALARYFLGAANIELFPLGTLLANYLGCFLLGALSVSSLIRGDEMKLYLAVGLLGALTTFSGFAFEALKMMEKGQWGLFATYIVVTNIGCLFLVYLGRRWV